MEYIQRAIAPILERSRKTFKVVLVTGPRQVGKSTVLRKTFLNVPSVSFDDKLELHSALRDPALFFQDNPCPLILDEVQYAAELFSRIKVVCDQSSAYGLFFLTGSQQFNLMQLVDETLSGRVAVHELQGLSLREIKRVPCNMPFVPTEEYFATRCQHLVPYDSIWERIHRGFNPELQNDEIDWTTYWSSYVQTYLERDVRQLSGIKDSMAFVTFMTALAARTGQLLNYAALADEVGKSITTIKEWVSVLLASGLIYLLQPYSSSALNRAIKTPKVYFRDTGLACYLTRWLTPQTLRASAMNGNMFETFVVSEIIKTFSNAGIDPRFCVYYYRGKDKKRVQGYAVESEIDLIVHADGVLYPIEIKMSATPDASMASAFDVLDLDKTKKRGKGMIVCLCDKLMHIRENLRIVPIAYI